MEDNGLPVPPEATPVEPGTEAVAPPETAAPETIDLKWGREERSVSREHFDALAEELHVDREALRTWVQMGRDASNVYSDSRRLSREAEARVAQMEGDKRALEARLAELNRSVPGITAPTRKSVEQDPVGFWNDVAAKVDKLDKLEKVDKIEAMLTEMQRRVEVEREAVSEAKTEQAFVQEYQRMAEEWKRDNLPIAPLQDIAGALDRFVTTVPDDVSVRDLLDMGYRIVTWDRIGKARANAEIKRRTSPRATIEIPSGAASRPDPGDGSASSGETLEQRRARLHRQVGGLTFQDLNASRDQG